MPKCNLHYPNGRPEIAGKAWDKCHITDRRGGRQSEWHWQAFFFLLCLLTCGSLESCQINSPRMPPNETNLSELLSNLCFSRLEKWKTSLRIHKKMNLDRAMTIVLIGLLAVSVILKVGSLDQHCCLHLELVSNARSWAPALNRWIRTSEVKPSNLCFEKVSKWMHSDVCKTPASLFS